MRHWNKVAHAILTEDQVQHHRALFHPAGLVLHTPRVHTKDGKRPHKRGFTYLVVAIFQVDDFKLILRSDALGSPLFQEQRLEIVAVPFGNDEIGDWTSLASRTQEQAAKRLGLRHRYEGDQALQTSASC